MMRRGLKNLSVAVVSLVTGFVACELFLRFGYAPEALRIQMSLSARGLGSDHSLRRVLDDGKFVHFEPGQSPQIGHVKYLIQASIDQYGWRRSTANPSAPFDVVFAGDSFTFGIGLEDHETFPWLLAERHGLNVVNQGAPGSDPVLHLTMIRANHASLGNPQKYFIVIFAGNDFECVLGRQLGRDLGARNRTSQNIDRYAFEKMGSHSYFMQLMRMMVRQVRARKQAATVGRFIDNVGSLVYQRTVPTDIRNALERGWLEYAQELNRLSAELGMSPAVLIVPDKMEVAPGRREHLLSYYGIDRDEIDLGFPRRFLREIFTENGVPVYDSTECLRDSGSSEKLYYDLDNHFTPAGAGAFADCVSDFVEGQTLRIADVASL